MINVERVDKLLRDLLDHDTDGGSAVSCFGDTGYDPAMNFPVCRRAVEELVSMGSDIIPRMLEVLDAKYEVPAFLRRRFSVASVRWRQSILWKSS